MYTIRSMHAYDLTLTTTGREIEPPIHTVVTSGTSHSRMASSTGPPKCKASYVVYGPHWITVTF